MRLFIVRAACRQSVPCLQRRCTPRNFSSTRLNIIADEPFTETQPAHSILPGWKFVELVKVKTNGTSPRFYKGVSVQQLPPEHRQGGHFAVLLGGRFIETAKMNVFAVPSRALALAIAQEWDSQITRIQPTSMPLMKIATTALDTVEIQKPKILNELRNNAQVDLAAIRTPSPPALTRLQAKYHDPLLEWAATEYGINIQPVYTLNAPDLSESTTNRIEELLQSMDNWHLSAFDLLGATTKSFVISLAVRDGFIDVEQAVLATRVEENFQIKIDGEIRNVHALDAAFVRLQISAARAYFSLLDLPKTLNPSL